MDNDVALLLRQSQQGQLQGTFFGRLHSLAVVPAPEDEVAVNAVLRELCSLVRWLSFYKLFQVQKTFDKACNAEA